jgi:hypothetical protein
MAREQDIIDVARATVPRLPELFVAGRMFFRFDPGFRAELDAARMYWRGSPNPIPTEGLSDEALFDLTADLGRGRSPRLLEAAYGLAARWGLLPDELVKTLAFDDPANYPIGVVQPWATDPISGLRYLELRVYSEYAWAPLRLAGEKIGWLQRSRNLAWFPDTPTRPYSRLRGLDAKLAARTMALYFLARPAQDARPTGGTRPFSEAVALWARSAADEPTPAEADDQQPGRLRRQRLLGLVYGHMMSARDRLEAIKDARDLPRDEWLVLLGIDTDMWGRIYAEEPVSASAWESICAALPSAADDLMTQVRG